MKVNILFFLFITSIFAIEPDNLEGYFYSVEWLGNKKFFAKLKEQNIDRCIFLKEKADKFDKNSFIMKRIFFIYKETDCDERLDIVKEHLSYNSDMNVRLSALQLANTFDKKHKKQLQNLIAKLKKKAPNTRSFQLELEKFEKSL